jgi:YbbR domain-containing protein
VTKLRSLVLGNWPLKLAAIGLATVLYAGVAISDGTRTWAGPVPIEVLQAPTGGALLELPGAIDEISYRAPADVASQLTAGSFRASIDLSAVQPRIGAEPVEVPVDVSSVDPRVRVIDYSPRGVNVRLDEVVTRAMPVAVDTGAVPEGIDLGPVIVDPRQVEVRGASSRVSNVRRVEGRVTIDASGINIDQDVQMEAFDELGALVPGVDIEPPIVRVSADVARQLAYATLPIVPDLNGAPATGWRISAVEVTPSVATVSGEDLAVRGLEAVATEAIDLGDRDASFVIETQLSLPEEVTVPGMPSVSVAVTLMPVEASRTFEIGTAVVGAQDGLDYSIGEGSVRVLTVGPLGTLDSMDIGSLVAGLSVAGLDTGEHRVTPEVLLPDGLTVMSMEPADVRVIIEAAR